MKSDSKSWWSNNIFVRIFNSKLEIKSWVRHAIVFIGIILSFLPAMCAPSNFIHEDDFTQLTYQPYEQATVIVIAMSVPLVLDALLDYAAAYKKDGSELVRIFISLSFMLPSVGEKIFCFETQRDDLFLSFVIAQQITLFCYIFAKNKMHTKKNLKNFFYFHNILAI